MTLELLLLILVIGTAIAFDFTNGFHDTGNAMATSIATGALKPKTAVTLSAVLNLVGAFLSVEVALTVTNAVIRIQDSSGAPRPEFLANNGRELLMIVFCGLIGGILWNLLTWLLGLPSSSSHALFGGLVGSTLAALGIGGVNWMGDGSKLDGVVGKVILPAFASPVVAALVATIGTWLVYRITTGVASRYAEGGFRWGQIGTASLVSLAHGTNDAQKTMGIIAVLLFSQGLLGPAFFVPFWVVIACQAAMALGTLLGGWRIVHTMGSKITRLNPMQGFCAETGGALTLFGATWLGIPVSTTHTITGAIVGVGAARRVSAVRWGLAGNIVIAWIVTMPAAALISAAVYGLTSLLG